MCSFFVEEEPPPKPAPPPPMPRTAPPRGKVPKGPIFVKELTDMTVVDSDRVEMQVEIEGQQSYFYISPAKISVFLKDMSDSSGGFHMTLKPQWQDPI